MRIGLDLGGTKIEAIALDGERVLARRRVKAPRDDYGNTIRAIGDLIGAVQQEAGERGSVGIGIPGAISTQTGLVKNANSVWLIGHPLDRDLERALGQPVRISNDANCFALSVATDGAGKGARCVFGVIVGTGTGAGIVVDGRVLEGRHRIAGEWGHNPLPWPDDAEWPGPPCYCGRSGCIETFLSGPGLVRTYEQIAGQHLTLRHAQGHAEQSRSMTAEEIAACAAGGDTSADAALNIYEGRMARALASIINVLDPDVIVLGGGLSNIERLYTNVPARWQSHVFSDFADTPIVRALHGDASGVRGAAWLW
jgi:fructokinase